MHVNLTGLQDEGIIANLHFTDWKVSIDKKVAWFSEGFIVQLHWKNVVSYHRWQFK